jgi:hypothetical protein
VLFMLHVGLHLDSRVLRANSRLVLATSYTQRASSFVDKARHSGNRLRRVRRCDGVDGAGGGHLPRARLLPPPLFAMLMMMALVTTAMTSPLLRRLGYSTRVHSEFAGTL